MVDVERDRGFRQPIEGRPGQPVAQVPGAQRRRGSLEDDGVDVR